MTVRTTKTFTRPSTTVAWYAFPKVVRDHIQTTYTDPGLRVSRAVTTTEDGLTRTIETIWKDRESLDTYLQDALCKQMFRQRRAYNKAAGITVASNTLEEDADSE